MTPSKPSLLLPLLLPALLAGAPARGAEPSVFAGAVVGKTANTVTLRSGKTILEAEIPPGQRALLGYLRTGDRVRLRYRVISVGLTVLEAAGRVTPDGVDE